MGRADWQRHRRGPHANLDKIFAENPGCRLSASGLGRGSSRGPDGQLRGGAHQHRAGRVVFQDLPRISRAIEDGSFFENAAYIEAMDDCKERDGALHLMGLLSDGGVHSHITTCLPCWRWPKSGD